MASNRAFLNLVNASRKLTAGVTVGAKPCKHCGTHVLGSPEKCPHCTHDFDDGRPRLGSAERPYDCRASAEAERADAELAEQWAQIEALIGTQAERDQWLDGFVASDPARWVGTNDPDRKPPGAGWTWQASDLTKAGGQWYRWVRELPPSKTGPIRKLLGYLIRTWLRRWLKRLDGR